MEAKPLLIYEGDATINFVYTSNEMLNPRQITKRTSQLQQMKFYLTFDAVQFYS